MVKIDKNVPLRVVYRLRIYKYSCSDFTASLYWLTGPWVGGWVVDLLVFNDQPWPLQQTTITRTMYWRLDNYDYCGNNSF